ncbi:MAG TPA: N-acetyltransferase [Microlunatus sp.]
MNLQLRPAKASDQPLIARALFAAWRWRRPWDEDTFQDHLRAGSPDSYVDDFGRRSGDGGIIAEEVSAEARTFAGAAWYRFFTNDDHRAGFVAEDIPELAVAVEPLARGRGLGRALLRELMDLATGHRIRALSLHVSTENTVARSLYQSLGFEVVQDHQDHGVVMLAELKMPWPEAVADKCVRRVRS